MRVANCVQGSSARAIYAALFFDPRGRPGPRRRLRRRRPFFAGLAVETLPSNDCIAERTSCCTRSRITVNKLLCLGIESSFAAADTRMADHQQKGSEADEPASGEACWRSGGGNSIPLVSVDDRDLDWDNGDEQDERRDDGPGGGATGAARWRSIQPLTNRRGRAAPRTRAATSGTPVEKVRPSTYFKPTICAAGTSRAAYAIADDPVPCTTSGRAPGDDAVTSAPPPPWRAATCVTRAGRARAHPVPTRGDGHTARSPRIRAAAGTAGACRGSRYRDAGRRRRGA
jgi:hypothetical protein